MAVSKRLRFEILRRDNHQCRYCGARAPEAVLTVDHVLPTTLGGDDDPTNLVAACKDCNAGKAATSPSEILVADVSQDAVRWARASAEAARLMDREVAGRFEFIRELDNYWQRWLADSRGPFPRPDDWCTSVHGFVSRGLPRAAVFEAMTVAADALKVAPGGRWRYFCGICWSKLRELEEATKALLAVEDAQGDL